MSVPVAGARLSSAFAQRDPQSLPGLIAYVTAGFPHLGDTPALLAAAERAGCLAAEIGLPFSDPLADGPTIQRTSQQALQNGMTVNLALEQVAQARGSGVSLPLALMTYVNPVLSYGQERFAQDAASAGADALILPDLPLDEAAQMRAAADSAGLALILLVAPTTPDARLAAACAHASGFVYCVSVTGTTGARTDIATEAFDLLSRVRGVTDLPRALGFGLSQHRHLEELRGHSEGAVVASALVSAIGDQPNDPVGAAERFLHSMLGEA